MEKLTNNSEEKQNPLLFLTEDNNNSEIQDTKTNSIEDDEGDIYDNYDAYDAEEEK
ncbi:MAG: hypothetical protein OHK0057_22620 [Thermoflexibacter sp.]